MEIPLEDQQQSSGSSLYPCYAVGVLGVTGCSTLSFTLSYFWEYHLNSKLAFQIPYYVLACGLDLN